MNSEEQLRAASGGNDVVHIRMLPASDEMQPTSVVQLTDLFESRLRNLDELLRLKTLKDADIVLEELATATSDLQPLLNEIKHEVQRQRSFEARIADLRAQQESLRLRHEYALKNVPDRLPQPNEPALKENRPPAAHPQSAHKSATQPRSSKKSKASIRIPTLLYVTVDEFKAVPAYAKGRITYDETNKVIDELNKVLAAKYRLLGLPKQQLSSTDWQKVEEYRGQESKDSQGTTFFVEGDVKAFSSLKVDRRLLSIFGILRHLGRLREVRGGQLIRYVCAAQQTSSA